ncbi:DUF4932 domain-containing protein [Pontibacter sp. H249]|uniref:DUF4932 domain-containing protein n=1 Tax=Pontibacter sp. H249 TaxID=3133420 RepID=UPI0030BCAD5B
MRKFLLLLFSLLTLKASAQDNVIIEIPESYELSNIILALTKYGRTDPWDVQKVSPYYNEVLKHFEPVKDHPLLDSVNYSRPEWEKFLGFRTDAYAFSFDADNKLKRDYPFNSFGPVEFDKNLELINDFVEKSNYRAFYAKHSGFYDSIVSNYKEYYFFDKTKAFLDNRIGKQGDTDRGKTYRVAVSPLVGGQNCHRDIDSLTSVDFPNISKDLILGKINNNGIRTRIVENHTIFTEMDHGYINPISDKYKKQIQQYFDTRYWDNKSGYTDINVFNEYMTWAVYDLFLKESFAAHADSIALQWHYQNASSNRGFIASDLFAKKVLELSAKNKGSDFENVYLPLLKWCKKNEKKIIQPSIDGVKANEFIQLKDNLVTVGFTEKMAPVNNFGAILLEVKDGKQTGKSKTVMISKQQNNLHWQQGGKKLNFKVDTDFQEFILLFNWWGIKQPLLSRNEVLLKPQSYLLLKK